MNKFRYSTMGSVLILIFATLNVHADGQTPPRKELPTKDYASQLRQSAVYVLDSAADEVREIEDIQARVEVAGKIIKLLATKRPERCRQMLNSLFDAALQLEKASPSNADPGRADPDAIVRKIIQLAAPFDRRLAQSYIDRYAAKEESNNREAQTTARLSPQTAELYLKLATELIEKDPTLAVSVAHKALRVAVPAQALVFLGTLRGQDINLANSFFLAALGSIKARGGSDVNELLLLYSYVFSPLQVPQAIPQGLAFLHIADYQNVTNDYPIDPALARQYLDAATQILLNSERYNPPQVERLDAGAKGDFLFIKIIEPQVASYLPALVSPLSVQRNILFTYLQPEQRSESQASAERWNNLHGRINQSSENKLETVDYHTQWAEQTSDPQRKNQLYYMAASIAVRQKKYDAALELIEKLSTEYRDQAKPFIMYQIAVQAARDRQLEKAEQWARRDVDLAQRAYIFTLIADSLLEGKSKDLARASELLDEIEQTAAKLGEDREKVAVLIGAVTVASRFNTARAAELLREAIKAANKVENFTGETAIARGLDIGGFYYDYSLYIDEFTFSEAVNRLARANFNETLVEMRELKGRLPRLKAVVALCGGVLSEDPRKKVSSL